MPRITQQEFDRAVATPIAPWLERRGYPLKRRGRDLIWLSPTEQQVSLHGNEWFCHYTQKGGGAVSFLQTYFGYNFPDAVRELLGEPAPRHIEPPRPPAPRTLVLPPRADDNQAIQQYLTQTRCLDAQIVQHFMETGQLYETTVRRRTGDLHNLVMVGVDERGNARHAHIKGTEPGSLFRIDAEGSDKRYSFGHRGTDGQLYVFEAGIDLLSYLSLFPDRWQQSSYITLNGVAEPALLHALDTDPHLHTVVLCLDHDPGGQLATMRLKSLVVDRGLSVEMDTPYWEKDWNEALRHAKGQPYRAAEEHPVLGALQEQCDWLLEQMDGLDPRQASRECIQLNLRRLRDGLDVRALQTSALCAAVSAREELRHAGRPLPVSAVTARLCAQCDSVVPDRAASRLAEVFEEIQAEHETHSTRTAEQSKRLANQYLDFAGKCLAVAVRQIEEQEVKPCQTPRF